MILSQRWAGWREALAILEPATVIRWHREGFRRFWRRRSRPGRLGRSGLDRDVVSLIRRVSQANVTWGAPRIRNELARLGIEVAVSTVARPVLTSMVALCTIRFRQSKRLAQELLSSLLNVDLSPGAISKIEQQTSEALAAPVEEAREYVREQAVANADETGWYEGKSDGRKQRAWLWVVTTSLVTVFKIAKSRGEDVAREMLGEFKGVLGVDRWSAYNFVDSLRRQLCWSHLKRDFLGFVDRGGKGAKIGAALLRHVDLMFTWRHRVRDGTLTRRTFQRRMEPVKEEIRRLLRAAVVRAEPKTRGMAKAILKVKWALFTFIRHPEAFVLSMGRGAHPTRVALGAAVVEGGTRFGVDWW